MPKPLSPSHAYVGSLAWYEHHARQQFLPRLSHCGEQISSVNNAPLVLAFPPMGSHCTPAEDLSPGGIREPGSPLAVTPGPSAAAAPAFTLEAPCASAEATAAIAEDETSDWGSDFDDLEADTGRATGYTEEEMAFFDARHRMEDLQIQRFNRQFRPPPPPRRTRPAP